ncbi:hypothetical protein NLJ89_g6380 [Agrocybe chaxingu]|uniref:CRAL-TRIO domain-containing protein n=1 Tax=Agrocybe chaxingu TaxID=84603 RepID=A0A9W8MWG4_9AGAR|nr:hypothetical protein NLJ89_g6380 [Agrocybe chaxingu]
METFKRLQINRDALLDQYRANLDDVYDLQDTLITTILPSVTDELELEPDAQEWVKEWLSDTFFRISRRNKFTRSFSLEAVQKNLLWRLTNLWPVERQGETEPLSPIPNFYCLPAHIRDPLGRPILVLGVAPVDEDLSIQKDLIIRAFERLRMHLKRLYDDSGTNSRPVLQYTVLLDLSQLSLQSINIDLFTWTVREVIPRFPGMIAGLFMLNYSWSYSGLWSVFKYVCHLYMSAAKGADRVIHALRFAARIRRVITVSRRHRGPYMSWGSDAIAACTNFATFTN